MSTVVSVCALTFQHAELSRLLGNGEDAHPGELGRALSRALRSDGCGAVRVLHALERRLRIHVATFERFAVGDLERLWWTVGSSLGGLQTAALLWRVGCDPRPPARRLERRLLEDLQFSALRRLAASDAAHLEGAR